MNLDEGAAFAGTPALSAPEYRCPECGWRGDGPDVGMSCLRACPDCGATPLERRTIQHEGDWPDLGAGMTLGSVCRDDETGGRVLVTDQEPDGRLRIVRLGELDEETVRLIQLATGPATHLAIARYAVDRDRTNEYLVDVGRLEVIGPRHPASN